MTFFFLLIFDFDFLQIFPLVSCIVQISFQLNLIANSLHRYLPYHHRKGWKEWGLVLVLDTVPFTAICQFVFIGICHLCYSSVILFSISPCFILLTPHIGRYRCFQGSICTWRGVHIYFFDGEIKLLVDFGRFSPIFTGSSTGIMPKSQHTMLGWQNARTGTLLWYQ